MNCCLNRIAAACSQSFPIRSNLSPPLTPLWSRSGWRTAEWSQSSTYSWWAIFESKKIANSISPVFRLNPLDPSTDWIWALDHARSQPQHRSCLQDCSRFHFRRHRPLNCSQSYSCHLHRFHCAITSSNSKYQWSLPSYCSFLCFQMTCLNLRHSTPSPSWLLSCSMPGQAVSIKFAAFSS